MLRQRVKNSETDRYINGRSNERDISISKYLINDRFKPKDKPLKKKLIWNESKKTHKVYLSLLKGQLFQSDYDNLETISRKKMKTLKNNDVRGKLISLGNEEIVTFKKSKVNKEPFKVLDAPSFKDDFYLHLLDWSRKNILAVGLGKELYFWDALKSSSSLSHSLDNNTYISSVVWLSDGNTLLIGTSTGKIIYWDAARKKPIQEYFNHCKRVGVISLKNDDFFSAGSQDNSIVNFDLRQKTSINCLEGHNQEVCGLKWSSDGNYLASGGNDNKLFIWSEKKSYYMKKFNHHKSAVKAIDWSPHKLGLLASGGGTQDRSIKFWNISTLNLIESIDTNSQVCNIKFDNYSNNIITTHGFSDNLTVIWDYPELDIVETLKGHRERVIYLAYSPDGKNIATGAGDETIRLWNINRGNKQEKTEKIELSQYNVTVR